MILHGTALDVELDDVAPKRRLLARLWAEPDDQRLHPAGDEHVCVQQEAGPAEYLLLDVLSPDQSLTDAFGQGFIKGHLSLLAGAA